MNVSLPESMKEWVDNQVETGGYGTVSEYIRELLRREQRRSVRAEINTSLIEVIRSDDFQPMAETEWDDIKDEGNRILARGRRKKAK